MKRHAFIWALTLAACAPTAASVRADLGPEPGPPIVGPAFEVHCHASVPAGCQDLATLLESKYAEMEAFLRLPNHPPERPMVVEVVSDPAAMHTLADKLGASPDVKALNSSKTFATYLLCTSCAEKEPSPSEKFSALVESFNAVGLGRIGNWTHEPVWMRQGAGVVFAEEQMHPAPLQKRVERLKARAAAGTLPSVEKIIHGDLSDISLAERNDAYWALYRFLRTPPFRAKFDDFLERAQSAPPKHYARYIDESFESAFGPLNALDADFHTYAASISL